MYQPSTKTLHYLVADYREEAARCYRLSACAIFDAEEYEYKSDKAACLNNAIYYQNMSAYLYAKASQIVEQLLIK